MQVNQPKQIEIKEEVVLVNQPKQIEIREEIAQVNQPKQIEIREEVTQSSKIESREEGEQVREGLKKHFILWNFPQGPDPPPAFVEKPFLTRYFKNFR